jgi:hypothetical protein
MGDGTEKNPYTRKDVLRLIKENGGKAKGLDLSEKYFEKGIILGELNLREIILERAHLDEAYLWGAHLERANLQYAHLEEAVLSFAHLEEAILANAYLERTYLVKAKLEGAALWLARFSRDTRLWNIDWGSYILMEEKRSRFTLAEETYRQLKIWYSEQGMYDIAAKFYYREMEIKRKAQSWKKKPHLKTWYWVMRMLCGYGEKPERVGISAAVIVLGLALIYFAIGTVWKWQAFWNSLYVSAVSFTALGYGTWVDVTNGWIKGIGAAESFIGVFMMALFLVTFTRKMTR